MNEEYFGMLKNQPRRGTLIRFTKCLNGRLVGKLGVILKRYQSPLAEKHYDEFVVLVDEKHEFCYRHEFEVVSL